MHSTFFSTTSQVIDSSESEKPSISSNSTSDKMTGTEAKNIDIYSLLINISLMYYLLRVTHIFKSIFFQKHPNCNALNCQCILEWFASMGQFVFTGAVNWSRAYRTG